MEQQWSSNRAAIEVEEGLQSNGARSLATRGYRVHKRESAGCIRVRAHKSRYKSERTRGSEPQLALRRPNAETECRLGSGCRLAVGGLGVVPGSLLMGGWRGDNGWILEGRNTFGSAHDGAADSAAISPSRVDALLASLSRRRASALAASWASILISGFAVISWSVHCICSISTNEQACTGDGPVRAGSASSGPDHGSIHQLPPTLIAVM